MKVSLPILLTLCITSLQADDWPQWLGPERDAVWREAGVIETFPEDGPEILWRMPVGLGYSSPAVADGNVYVSDYEVTEGEVFNNPGSRGPLKGNERIHCLDLETGEVIWTHSYDRPYNLSYPGGPRATPTIADGKVYHLGAEGDFVCLDAGTGEVVWQHNFQEKYGIESAIWGFASHPLVLVDTVYTVAGGEGSVAVAFDKETGEEKWTALSAAAPGYCPPTPIEHAGVTQLLFWHSESINALNPTDGSIYWSLPLKPRAGMAIAAPQKEGDLLYITGHGKTAAVIRLGADATSAEIEWKASPREAIFAANSTPIIHEGIIYGSHIDDSSFMAARLSDGERLWSSYKATLNLEREPERGGRHGTAFITRHEPSGKYYLFAENGDLIIADLSPEGYAEHSRANILEPTNEAFGRPVVWAAPAFAGKSVLVRNDKEIVRVNLAK